MGSNTREFKDPSAGYAKAWTEYRITEDELHMQHVEDVTEILQVNKFLKTFSPQELTNKKTGWRWVARLPLSLDLEMAKKGVYTSKAAFNRWKNDPDNAAFALCRDRKPITTPSGLHVVTNKRREE